MPIQTHPEKSHLVRVVCDGGCGSYVDIRKNKITHAQYYICNTKQHGAACREALPICPPKMITNMTPCAAASFTGLSYKKMSHDEAASLQRASALAKFVQGKPDTSLDAFKYSKNALHLLEVIISIPGEKIVTVTNNTEGVNEFDINADGQVGYHPTHRDLILSLFTESRNDAIGVLIRQFIPGSEEPFKLKNGKTIKMPWKALYGVAIANDQLFYLPAEDVENAITTDARTGARISEEERVICRDLAEFDKEFVVQK